MMLLEQWHLARKGARANIVADPIIHRVTSNGGNDQKDHQPPDIQRTQGRNRARRKEQRITRQERRNHQASFGEDNYKEDGIRQRTIICRKVFQMVIKMENKIKHVSLSLSLLSGRIVNRARFRRALGKWPYC